MCFVHSDISRRTFIVSIAMGRNYHGLSDDERP